MTGIRIGSTNADGSTTWTDGTTSPSTDPWAWDKGNPPTPEYMASPLVGETGPEVFTPEFPRIRLSVQNTAGAQHVRNEPGKEPTIVDGSAVKDEPWAKQTRKARTIKDLRRQLEAAQVTELRMIERQRAYHVEIAELKERVATGHERHMSQYASVAADYSGLAERFHEVNGRLARALDALGSVSYRAGRAADRYGIPGGSYAAVQNIISDTNTQEK